MRTRRNTADRGMTGRKDISMKRYVITYHMYPYEDIVISIPAKSMEDAIIFAKEYRKDAFSIEEETV